MKFSITVLTSVAAALVASAPVTPGKIDTPALPIENPLERVVEAFFKGSSIDAEAENKVEDKAVAEAMEDADAKTAAGSQKRDAEAKPHWTTYGYYEPQKRDAVAEADAEAKPHWTTYGYYEPQK
ncbi:Mfalpha alpha factor mating pheromone precursor [Candida orthopsilosis Co 90-125]|uniref:Mfalpha alpha factor mating pheromone n=1 Tax=Candida orthopsilosis (strain 90-125) TaxID=1136231 RepID=H8X034_CANO9|nr:Mfalpha alpha factor mating pheromone precursor [Candida orthopsilosis Co 90-125]CCG22545.1 Mfalpha alpha factor mating pheromone precursor [Candida orthopsilosis Co 90-125]